GSDEHAAGDMISADDHTLTGTLIVPTCRHPHTLPMAWTAASTRLASSSQNLAHSGLSRLATTSLILSIAFLNWSVSAAFLDSIRSLSMIASGVPFGANRPTQSENSTS